ncbi:MAG TPA: serine hydrolase [Ktedonobacteraceae bacterium]|nr:serine hydrolase [Ktedonobacteraceae bacterium]
MDRGIASSAIQSFVDAVEQRNLGVHSLMLVRNGILVAEGWWKPYASHLPHSMFSISKSFTSTAIGLAISEGRLSLDDPILSFFPSYVTPEIRENMGALQLRHLLSMSTGHAEDTFPPMTREPDGDWVRIFLSMPITYPPGTHFLYNTGASFMLSAILQSLTGQTLLEYLQPRLFEPLGIDLPTWQSTKSGINLGGTGLSLRTADLAKFGQLYLQRGVWNGRSVVPEAWIEEATRTQVSNGDNPDSDWNQGYGFQFWRSRHNTYRADGAFGQFCIVMPQYNAILAMTSGTRDMQGILNAVWEYILPGLDAEPLAESSQTTADLKERLAHLVMPFPKTLAVEPITAARISNRSMQFEENTLHTNEAFFTFEQDRCTFTVRDDKGTQHVIHCGLTDWIAGETSLWFPRETPGTVRIAAQGGWTNDHTFVMIWQYIETPFRQTITCDFHPDETRVSIQVDQSFWTEQSEQLHGRLK